jgi:hypothetical protein
MSQPTLFGDAPIVDMSQPPATIPVNGSVDPREVKRLGEQCEALLARLRSGPASNRELSAIALKYTSRISDLRAAGYQVEAVSRNYETGETIYELK